MIERLELEPDNPYFNGTILNFSDGTQELEAPNINYVSFEGDKYYTIRELDTLRSIAWNQYKDLKPFADRYWWVIYLANLLVIEVPMDLAPHRGEEIVIPDIENFELTYINA